MIRGTLKVTVYKATNLPYAEIGKHSKFPCCCGKNDIIAEHLPDFGTFVKISLDGYTLGKTKSCTQIYHKTPVWSETSLYEVAHEAEYLKFEVLGDLVVQDNMKGHLSIRVADMVKYPNDCMKWGMKHWDDAQRNDRQLWPLVDDNNAHTKRQLKLDISFKPASEACKEDSLTDVYFPARDGNKITLYQDCVTPQMELFNEIKTKDGEGYKAASCFKDMEEALLGAKKLIYSTGWSFWPHTILNRDGENQRSVGEILKEKAEEGVVVLLLMWDEQTANDLLPEMMGTFCEETKKFFKHSKVHCAHVHANKEHANMIDDYINQKIFSHHQKTLVADAEIPNEKTKRRLVAFVGGIDITKGRYDTYEHQLFSTLDGVHKDDFLQPFFETTAKTGPRMPWHDIHSKIEGPTARDVARCFEERWRMQTSKQKLLVPLVEREFDTEHSGGAEDNQLWNCQVFRSITEQSSKFDEKESKNLTTKAGVMTDDSIMRAFVHQIRRAEKFLYIENQYFLGSAYSWLRDSDIDANQVIPIEVVNRIGDKIKAKERFCAYIVIPMHPDEDPANVAIQEMMKWQYNTINMMYHRIAKLIKENGGTASPRDYLNVYCLGTRESQPAPESLDEPDEGSLAARLREKRRCLIYVHSKMMIVDDSYIIVGSANINERSMSGNRDSELAMGAYQKNFKFSDGSHNMGKVSQFRKALWAEHLNTLPSEFDDPSSIDCVKKVNEIANKNWDIFVAEENKDTQGHLMSYPYKVGDDGTVEALEGYKTFPDFDACILGQRNDPIPSVVTA